LPGHILLGLLLMAGHSPVPPCPSHIMSVLTHYRIYFCYWGCVLVCMLVQSLLGTEDLCWVAPKLQLCKSAAQPEPIPTTWETATAMTETRLFAALSAVVQLTSGRVLTHEHKLDEGQ